VTVAVAELRWTLRDCLLVTGRNMRHFTRQPALLLFSTIQPVMFIILFSYVFGGAIGGSLPEGVSYVSFLLPGIFIQSAAFRASQTAVGLAEDMNKGVVDRLRSMPMSRAAVLVGRTGADLVRTLFVVVLMILVGYLIGFRFTEGVPAAVGAVAVVCLFSLALSWIFAFIGLVSDGAETAQSAGFVAIFPLVFASSVFVPIETMPSWLEGFASVSPVTLAVDSARALSLGGDVAGPLLGFLVWVAGILAVFVPLCVWRFRRMG
jgi:ABC-2 type transport system permease protein/oleandomycin transport system permease protein